MISLISDCNDDDDNSNDDDGGDDYADDGTDTDYDEYDSFTH